MVRNPCLMFLLFIVFSSASANIALNKPGLASSLYGQNKPSSLTNGRYTEQHECAETNTEEFAWLAVNLEKSYKLEKIRVIPFPPKYRREDPVNIYVASRFRACAPELNLQLCAENVKLPDEPFDIQCKSGLVNAQYIFISKKNSTTPLMICEVEAFGSEVSGAKPDARPQLPDERPNLNDLTIGARKVILNGIETLRLPPYTTAVTYYKRTSEAILWTHDDKSAVMVASEVGKGKLITCGNHNFIQELYSRDEYARLRQNLNQWFNVPVSAVYHELYDNSKDAIQDGEIIFIQSIRQLDAAYVAQIFDRLKSGRNPVIIAWKGWVHPEDQVNMSVQPIFNEAGVSITPDITNYSPRTLTPAQYQNDHSTLPVEIAIDIFQKSSSFFTENAASILRSVSNILSNDLISLTPGMTKLRDQYNSLVDWLTPCNSNPISDQKDKNILASYNGLVLSQAFAGSGYKVPYVNIFPGDVPSSATLISVKVQITSDNSGEFHPTGYYLPPGGTLKWEVVQQTGKPEDWVVRIGCHTDDNSKKEEYKRFPIISNEVPLSSGRIYSPFGGVVWIRNNRANVSITLILKDVVEAPLFNLRDPQYIANWNRRRNAPAPWAELAGDMMIFCVESKHIRNLDVEYVRDLMENTWDRIVKLDLDLKGKDWRNERRERTTTDVQISAGSGHSGYPIMTHLYWIDDMLNKKYLAKEGSWGMCHEIGHNMQEGRWTPGGTGEVTNNLMCLYNYDRLGWNFPEDRLYTDNSERIKEISDVLSKSPSGNDWTSGPFIALGFYAQLATHFGFGFYSRVFRLYNERKLDPQSDIDKLSTWLETSSNVTDLNLSPLFDFWGISYSDQARQAVSKLRCFFPKDDAFVRAVPSRAATIRGKNSNCVGTASKIGCDGPWDLATGMKGNDLVVL